MKDKINRDVLSHTAALQVREYSSEELVRSYLGEISEKNKELNAFITICEDSAIEEARQSDLRRAEGKTLGALDGIPIAIKDNICTKDISTTCASKMLCDYIPPYDATVVERLRAAGAVILGKTNMDEFAMGSTGETSYFGATRNPWNIEYSAGGSSSGSAAAVAADLAPIALGTDTGGSVRQPAAFCGVVGIKPTYGRVSRYGLVAFAPSLEQIGVISKTVRDGALLLDIISGKDNRDAMSLEVAKTELPPEACSSLSGVRVGLPRELFGKEVGDGVRAAVMIAADTLAALGAEVFEVSVPSLSYSSEAYYVISSAEASSNLARFDGIRYGHRAEGTENIDELYKKSRTEGFGAEVKRRIMLGAFVLSAGCQEEYYARAQKVRRLISNELEKAFESCDILLSPSAVTTAYKLGEEKPSVTDVYADDLCSVVANLAGLPAVSLPCKSSTSLPVGVQLMGKPMSEGFLLRVAEALEYAQKN